MKLDPNLSGSMLSIKLRRGNRRASLASIQAFYSEDQPRDERGRFGETDGESASTQDPRTGRALLNKEQNAAAGGQDPMYAGSGYGAKHEGEAASVDRMVQGAEKAGLDGERARELLDPLPSTWDATAADHDANALAFQTAIAAEFGGDKDHFIADRGAELTGKDAEQFNQMTTGSDMDILRAGARAEYDATQAHLKEAGIENVRLYRGDSRKFGEVGTELTTKANPLTSWSTDSTWSGSFAHGTGSTVQADVPASQIFSYGARGWGGASEGEVISLGDKPIPAVVTHNAGPPSPGQRQW